MAKEVGDPLYIHLLQLLWDLGILKTVAEGRPLLFERDGKKVRGRWMDKRYAIGLIMELFREGHCSLIWTAERKPAQRCMNIPMAWCQSLPDNMPDPA